MANINPHDFVILNVDDNDPARYAKSRILKHAGFGVEEAANGTDALEKAREMHPDLVLLDTKLPDMNGFEVCRRLKEDSETRPILILQTSASFIKTTDKIDALESGADNYLFEPIEPDELIANVKALIRLSKAEHELRLANQRKDEFLATLAHELRNPLGPIRNAVEILKLLDPDVPPRQANAREIILRQTKHMVRLIDDLLDVSRISLGKINMKKEFVELDNILNNAIETSAGFIASRSHAFEIDKPAEQVWLYGDSVRLAQIITNLLHNAAKFTPPGGTVSLAARREGNDVLITITDTGIGIPIQSLRSIFELFAQDRHSPDRVQDGLGIGLSLVKKLAEMHDGYISAQSQGVGMGSTFEVKLPVAQPPESLADIVPEKADAQSRKLGILIVDDNSDSADSLSEWMRMLGHNIHTAYTGSEGIRIASEIRPDVVFLDIGLPDINGYKVAEELRKALAPTTKLIALSGYGTDNDRAQAIASGFDLHLVKPIDTKRLDQLGLGLTATEG